MPKRWILVAAAALLVTLPRPSLAESDSRLRLDVESSSGDHVHLDLGTGWLTSLIAAADVTCEGSDDRRTRRMAHELSRQGEGGVYEFRDRDGDAVTARRSRGQLILETRRGDGDRAVVEMPWLLAECTMLGREPEGGLTRYLRREGLSLKVDAHDGGDHVRLSFD